MVKGTVFAMPTEWHYTVRAPFLLQWESPQSRGKPGRGAQLRTPQWSALIQSLSTRPGAAAIGPGFIFKLFFFKIQSILYSDSGVVSLSSSDTEMEILLDSLPSDDPS